MTTPTLHETAPTLKVTAVMLESNDFDVEITKVVV